MKRLLLLVSLVGSLFACVDKEIEQKLAAAAKISVETGTTKDGKEYSLLSGDDAFAPYYVDNFDYKTKQEFLDATSPDGGKAWEIKTTFNLSGKAVDIIDGKLVLSVLRVDKTDAVADVEGFKEGFTDNEVNRSTGEGYDPENDKPNNGRNYGALVGGVSFGEPMEYGYLEATLTVENKPNSGYWCGFYTYGTKRDAEEKWVGGYEFDIFEQPTNKKYDVVSHWPYANANGRFATFYRDYPANNGTPVKAAVAWTPEKVVYYINDEVKYVLENNNLPGYTDLRGAGNIKDAVSKANSHKNASANSKYQVVANIPQDIQLVVAANGGGDAGYSGTEPNIKAREHGYRFEFIKYENFKLYKYVGKK